MPRRDASRVPLWDGFLDNTCSVPTHLGRRTFRLGDGGVDFAAIESYCVTTRARAGKRRRKKRRATSPRHLTTARTRRPATKAHMYAARVCR